MQPQQKRSVRSEEPTRGWDSRERIMDDLTELYSCRPAKSIFERAWHPDAVFEDSLVKAQGRSQYEPQWFAMPWLFSRSQPISRRVILSTNTPNRLVYTQVQEYTLRFLGTKQRLESLIDIELDESDRINRMVDKRNGKELPTRYGAEWLRSLNGRITPWLVKVREDGAPPAARPRSD